MNSKTTEKKSYNFSLFLLFCFIFTSIGQCLVEVGEMPKIFKIDFLFRYGSLFLHDQIKILSGERAKPSNLETKDANQSFSWNCHQIWLGLFIIILKNTTEVVGQRKVPLHVLVIIFGWLLFWDVLLCPDLFLLLHCQQ